MRVWLDGSGTGLQAAGVPGFYILVAASCFLDAVCCSEPTLNHDALAKLTVTVIVLVALLVWRVADQKKSIECGTSCPTDVSASRKPAQ